MPKQKIKVEFNGKLICSKYFNLEDNLLAIRERLNDKINGKFIFLDKEKNYLDNDDEEDFTLKDIIDEEFIKLETPKNNPINESKENNNLNVETCEKNSAPTPINKEKEKAIQKITDFSLFEIIRQRKDLTIYKYSNKERKSNHELVYQYFYDELDAKDLDEAFVVLFCGKTGDGKSTAINAFFNIVKGIELKDSYRFILITEPKKEKGQAESQTDGIHLYYLKDYNNKPIIIIDSQGFGDTRGPKYDLAINNAFRYVFSNVINHINTVCFISKACTNRFDITTRYIFSSVTSLFSEDITENFLVIATFATKDTQEEGPAFVESIKTDADFLNIQNRLNEKWWYAFDSKTILDNDEDRITKYSFSQITELYEKIKQLPTKNIEKCAEVLEARHDLRVKINLLGDIFDNLVVNIANLQIKNKIILENSIKIKDIEASIQKFENYSKSLSPSQLEKKLRELNEDLNSKLNDLNCEIEQKYINSCEFGGKDNSFTHCDVCQRNCHNYCDCFGRCLGRCKVFSWGVFGDKKCGECGCLKEKHRNDNYHWIQIKEERKKDNSDLINKEKERNKREKEIYLQQLNSQNESKNEIDRQINELNYNKKMLLEEKERNDDEKKEIEKELTNTRNQITFTIIKLKNLSQKLSLIAMTSSNIKTEDEYIDSLRQRMDEIGIKDEEQKETLKKMKDNNKIFYEVNNLNEKEVLNLSDEELAEKLSIIIPKSRKEQK